MQKYYFVLTASLGIIIGIVSVVISGVSALGIAVCLVLSGSWLVRERQKRLAFWLGAFVCLGGIRGFLYTLPQENVLEPYYGLSGHLSGYICGDVQRGYQDQRFVMCLTSFRHALKTVRFTPVQKIQVKTRLYPLYRFGQGIAGHGALRLPENFDDFDYRAYLQRRNIAGLVNHPFFEPDPSSDHWSARTHLYRLREKFSDVFSRGLPDPYSGIAQAMILGEQRTIPDTAYQSFVRSGILHIIAISGSHITVFAGILNGFLPWLGVGRRRAFWIVTISIIGYILLAGAPPSAVRAGIMGGLVLLARQVGRLPQSTALLLLAAAGMLLVHPAIFYEVGFQLSFCAVWGIMVLASRWTRGGTERDFLGGLHEGLCVTAAATLATLPVTLWHFQSVSVLSLPANLLTLPLAAALMVSLLLGLLVTFILPAWTNIIFMPSTLLLMVFTKISDIFSGPVYGYIGFESVSPALALGLTGLIILYAYGGYFLDRVKKA